MVLGARRLSLRVRLTINNQLSLTSIPNVKHAGSFWVALTQAVQLKRLRNVTECVRIVKEGIMKTFGDHNNSEIVAKNHDKFLEHLDTSIDTVFICARYLYDKGHTVTINAMTKAKTYGDWKVHADKGDLEVLWNGVPKRIEVKGISTDFVDASDWKFPDFIVCAAHSWDKADPKPEAYFIFNKKRTHVAIVLGKHSHTWTKAGKYDKPYTEYAQEFYFSPLDKILWRKV